MNKHLSPCPYPTANNTNCNPCANHTQRYPTIGGGLLFRSRVVAWISLCILLGGVGGLGGCVTATVEQVRHSSTEMTAEDSVVVLGRRHASGYETETDFVSCVGKKLTDNPSISVIDEPTFIDQLYPWFEPRTAPQNVSDLPNILNQESVSSRIEASGIRYIIWVDGSTNRTDSNGSMTCTISLGGGGCFGFLSWDKDSSYESTIWDVRSQRGVGKISSDASGTSFMPALIVPIPMIARTQSSACDGLADQLATFLLES